MEDKVLTVIRNLVYPKPLIDTYLAKIPTEKRPSYKEVQDRLIAEFKITHGSSAYDILKTFIDNHDKKGESNG